MLKSCALTEGVRAPIWQRAQQKVPRSHYDSELFSPALLVYLFVFHPNKTIQFSG